MSRDAPAKPYLEGLYREIEPGYYDHVFRRGSGTQWFWHEHRFRMVRDRLPGSLRQILDVGCGPGTFLGNLPEGTFERALGLDLAAAQIDYAQRNYARPGLAFRAADARDDLGSERFDVVVSIEVIEHLPRAETGAFLRTLFELLEPGGTLILTTPNYRSLWPLLERLVSWIGPIDYRRQHINPFTRERLQLELEAAGFVEAESRTFFLLAPFAAAFSARLARRLLAAEQVLFSAWGSELVFRARRPAQAHP